MDRLDCNAPAGIAYHGVAGSSADCEEAVVNLITGPCGIDHCRIITSGRTHCLLLTTDIGDPIAIKSGFSSGYGGSGPAAFSKVLQLLESHGARIDELDADPGFLERLNLSALTNGDLEAISQGKPILPSRWRDYVRQNDFERSRDGTLWHQLPAVIPYAIIDPRIMDLAVDFWADPDARLMKGYRRLEDTVRERTGLDGHNKSLFDRAFKVDGGPLTWEVPDHAERAGRQQMFVGAFLAYRNPRAHREKHSVHPLVEFLALNNLFVLEAEAVSSSGSAARPPVQNVRADP